MVACVLNRNRKGSQKNPMVRDFFYSGSKFGLGVPVVPHYTGTDETDVLTLFGTHNTIACTSIQMNCAKGIDTRERASPATIVDDYQNFAQLFSITNTP